MQPKVIQKLRPYYTYMHLRSATFKDRGRKRQVFDSTLIPHDNVRVLRLKHIETQTENMDTIKHLEKYESSNHHVGRLRKRAPRGWGGALRSIYYKIKLHFPEPITRRPEGWDGFHSVFSPSIRVSKLKTLYPPRFYQFNIKSSLAQYIPPQPLFTPLGIPRHKMRFIIIHVVGHKITDKLQLA